jgi:hypothetical protein
VLTCEAHAYSEASEAADASHMSAGRKVRVMQRDPANSASPLSWDDVVASQTGNTVTLTTGLTSPTYDAGLSYRIYWDDYADALSEQRIHAYQADDADGMVANLRVPYEYVAIGGQRAFTANAASDAIEMLPDASFGDGRALDVGHETAIVRLINNLMDLKTAISTPYIGQTEMAGLGVDGGATWRLLDVRAVNFTVDKMVDMQRLLSVAPHLKSSDGASASVRISLCRTPPKGDTLDDVDRGGLYADATFTTSSTTYATPTAQQLPIKGVPDPNRGVAYIVLEGTVKAKTYGISICQEGPRE